MPRNGSGTYSRTNGVNSGATVWQLDRDALTNILALRHDTHDQDLAQALTDSLAKDGQTTPTANFNWGGFKIANLGAGTVRTDAARVGQIQDGALNYAGTVGGTGNGITCSLSPAPTAFVAGMTIWLIAANSNSGATTLNPNGVGAGAVVRGQNGNLACIGGEIVSGNLYGFTYDTGGGGRWKLLNPEKILLQTNQFLKSRNNAGTGEIDLIKADSADNTYIDCPAAKNLDLGRAGTALFRINTSGAFCPIGNATQDLGAAATQLNNMYGRQLASSGALLGIGTLTAHDVKFFTSGSYVWVIDGTTNAFYPVSTYDLGKSASPIGTLYANNLSGMTYAGWSPTIGSSGGSISSTSVAVARKTVIGKKIDIHLTFSGTLAGGGVPTFTLPVASNNNLKIPVLILQAAATSVAYATFTASSATVVITAATVGGGAISNGTITVDADLSYESV